MPRSIASTQRNDSSPNPSLESRRRLQALRAKLAAERTSWLKWMSRLKRVFHTVEKIHAKMGRIEKEIGKLENA